MIGLLAPHLLPRVRMLLVVGAPGKGLVGRGRTGRIGRSSASSPAEINCDSLGDCGGG